MENPKHHQIKLSYETWEPLLKDKLNQLELFLEAVKYDLSCAGLSRKDATEFLNERIAEIRQEIQDSKANKHSRRAG